MLFNWQLSMPMCLSVVAQHAIFTCLYRYHHMAIINNTTLTTVSIPVHWCFSHSNDIFSNAVANVIGSTYY